MIKAIETRYKGYRFRSRLEARWAVFFEALGYQWEYEPEGFVMPSGVHYLPDFKVTLHAGNIAWYEIKPSGLESDEKHREFSMSLPPFELKGGDHFSKLLSGDPLAALEKNSYCPACGVIGASEVGGGGGTTLFACPFCSDGIVPDFVFTAENGVGSIGYQVEYHKGMVEVDNDDLFEVNNMVLSATRKARAARFEHGEAP